MAEEGGWYYYANLFVMQTKEVPPYSSTAVEMIINPEPLLEANHSTVDATQCEASNNTVFGCVSSPYDTIRSCAGAMI